jgi:hypothetical protein
MPAFTLMEHQVEGVDFIDAHDGIAALLYDPGVGKQQPVSEPVLTPSGWVSIGTLVPGDEVMAMDGTPTEVLSVHPQTERTVFKVVMNDGSYTYAGPEHLWLARTHNHARRNTDYSVVTTDTLRAEHHKRWEIPMAQPVQFPETDAMDAYLAGVIAGDGSCGGRGVELCTDVEIISSLGLSLSRLHETASYVGYAYVPVAQHNHEFKGQRSWEKELPLAVVRGSVDQRYAALQGLLDTDGSPIATGGVEYSTASETLADQVKWLVESLGGSARAGVVRAPKYTYKGETLEGRLSYRLNIKMPSGLAPFRLSRKLAAWVAPTKYPVKRCVKSVEFSHHEDSVCIRVAHPTSTYLTRSFIVTHNTGTTLTWVDQQAARLAKSKQPREFRVLVVAPKTACDTWVLQVAGFMDATVKARFLTGQTKTILTKIRAAADWRKVPDSTIKANHKGDPRVSGNAKVTILAISSGSISSWCRDDPKRQNVHGTTIGTGQGKRQRTVQLLQAVRKFAPDLVVMDESHTIKSHDANLSEAMYNIGQLVPHRIILTGTVNPHSPLDCYGQWRFLAPWTFSDQASLACVKSPLKMTKAEKMAVKPWAWGRFEKLYATYGGHGGKQVTGVNPISIDDLHDRVAARSHVVRKEDALDLPPVVDIDVHVHLTPAEQRAYDQMRAELAMELESGELLTAPNALAKMMKLRQITAGFIKDTDTGEIHVIGRSKNAAVEEVVNVRLAGENRIVVFAYFQSECAGLAAQLQKKGRTVEVITGKTKDTERLAIRQRFADVSGNPEQTVLVAQMRTMSISVNELVVAQHAVYASRSERREDTVQSRGRLDRNGQTGQKVTFWNCFVDDSIDTIMMANQENRKNMEMALLDHIRMTPRTKR